MSGNEKCSVVDLPAGRSGGPDFYRIVSSRRISRLIPACINICRIPSTMSKVCSALAYFGPHWWFAMRMIQTPMVGLVAVGLSAYR